jgi:O-acetyl-ADP-ribose deacetylase (regulator of RNase III)
MARARENDVATIAFPALGTGVGGYPLDEAARITLAAIRDELGGSPSIEVVTFALRGAAAYAAFQAALNETPAGDGSSRGERETASAQGAER